MLIRFLEPKDLSGLLTLWNQCLPHDAVDAKQFARRVLYDVNFDPALFLICEEADQPVGFCYLTVRRVPDEISGLEEGKGYLVAMGVLPHCRRKGIGRALVARAHALFAARKVQQVMVGCYADNYFCPGVDLSGYPEGVPFLAAMGYETRGETVSMRKNLHGFVYPKKYQEKKQSLLAKGYRFAPYTVADALPLFAFLHAEFPYWLPMVRKPLAEGRGEETLILAHAPEGGVAGFVLRAMDGCDERFGPFGVASSTQGTGIGTVLFHEMMQSMLEKHIFYTYFLWTGGRNIDIYSTWDMQVYRTYAMMSKNLKD